MVHMPDKNRYACSGWLEWTLKRRYFVKVEFTLFKRDNHKENTLEQRSPNILKSPNLFGLGYEKKYFNTLLQKHCNKKQKTKEYILELCSYV